MKGGGTKGGGEGGGLRVTGEDEEKTEKGLSRDNVANKRYIGRDVWIYMIFMTRKG